MSHNKTHEFLTQNCPTHSTIIPLRSIIILTETYHFLFDLEESFITGKRKSSRHVASFPNSCTHINSNMPSALDALKRKLVSVLLEAARIYNLALNLTRASPDKDVSASYRKVMLKVHLDKPGGSASFAKRIRWQPVSRALYVRRL